MKTRFFILSIFMFSSLLLASDDAENKIELIKDELIQTAKAPMIHHTIRDTGPYGENAGSAYLKNHGRIRVRDLYPVNLEADPSAYMITGTQFSMEAWVFPMRMPDPDQRLIIVHRPGGPFPETVYQLSLVNIEAEGGSKYQFILSDRNTGSTAYVIAQNPAVTGEWAHIAGTYDGSTAKLYINGELVNEIPYTDNIGEGETGFYIGGYAGGSYFYGLIDEVRLWNINRSRQEIQTFMNSTLNGDENGLAGYWPLDEATTVNGSYPVTVDMTMYHNDLYVQFHTGFVGFVPGSDVLIAPEFMIEPLYAVVNEFFEYTPFTPGWPEPETPKLLSGPAGVNFEHEDGYLEWEPRPGQDGYHEISLETRNSVDVALGTYDIWVDVTPIQVIEHNSNAILSVFNNGVIGASFGPNINIGDVGFVFNGLNGLHEGDLVIALSEDQVSGGLYQREFGTQSEIEPISSYLPGFDKAFETHFHDRRSMNPIGVQVTQRSHSKATAPDNDYVILDYEIMNVSGRELSEIYVALTMDWDVGNYWSNLGGYDSERRLSYVYESETSKNPFYYGILALSGVVSGHAIGIGNDKEDILYRNMTSFSELPTEPDDLQVLLSMGPINLPQAGKCRAMFAIVGGEDLEDLLANADAALAVRYQPRPVIQSVNDVPNDQGGRVTLEWGASSLDNPLNDLRYYSIWRALPPEAQFDSRMNWNDILTADFQDAAIRVEEINGDSYAWEWLANQPAHQFASYSYTAETLYDSTSMTDGMHYFLISAHAQESGMYFDSQIDSGYSVDNLAPLAPVYFSAWYNQTYARVNLNWDRNREADLKHYQLYRSSVPGIDPAISEPFAVTTDSFYIDWSPLQSEAIYYIACAADIHENLSPASNEVVIMRTRVKSTGGTSPEEYALFQNYPNPFNPQTTIRFHLMDKSNVRLTIHDMSGRLVRTLVSGQIATGKHVVHWNARDNAGRMQSSGIYLYRLKTGEFTDTRKLLFLK